MVVLCLQYPIFEADKVNREDRHFAAAFKKDCQSNKQKALRGFITARLFAQKTFLLDLYAYIINGNWRGIDLLEHLRMIAVHQTIDGR